MENTRGRILDSAERLFAEQGFSGTSLRQITAAAGANLAAVNYHFGSKEELIKEALSRRLRPINAERLKWLDRLEAEGQPTVEEIVDSKTQTETALEEIDAGARGEHGSRRHHDEVGWVVVGFANVEHLEEPHDVRHRLRECP